LAALLFLAEQSNLAVSALCQKNARRMIGHFGEPRLIGRVHQSTYKVGANCLVDARSEIRQAALPKRQARLKLGQIMMAANSGMGGYSTGKSFLVAGIDDEPSNGQGPIEMRTTARAVVPALERMLGNAFPVLDHGFIRVIDYMGDDSAIVQAARVSYGRGTKKASEDRALIRYLLRHQHTTPFEMAEIKLHVKLPIFVAREWIRHRTANVNEYSARYSILDREFYIPKPEDLAAQSASNRQGRAASLEPVAAREVLESVSYPFR
jgi:hypothetical protein